VDPDARARLGELSGSGPLGEAVASLLPTLAPRSVVEDWPRVASESSRRLGEPCSVVVGNYWTREVENEFVARCEEAGHGIAFVQHGGTYCSAAANPQERLETSDGATFLAWGRCDGARSARTAPSPYLAGMRDRHRGGDTTVLVEWLVPTYPHRFSSTPLGNQVHDNARLLGEMVEALPAGPVRDSLFLKRYPGAVAHVPRAPVLEGLPHPGRLQSPLAVDWMRKARIAVITYPDTTLIEAMVLGVPLIGLWRPELWNMRPGAAEHFERLERLGIVFGDASAAAERLSELYARAPEWWASAEVREARLAFLDHFAVGGDWLPDWTAALEELAR
jgi:putative transferase (TIGR04331 family)